MPKSASGIRGAADSQHRRRRLRFVAVCSSMVVMSCPCRLSLPITAALLGLAFFPASIDAGAEPRLAISAADPVLWGRLATLSPEVDPDEARKVALIAFTTGRELAREWRVVWPPGYHNFLVNRGRRKGGLCFQWATELLARLDALKLQTLELHWAEAFSGTLSEHNVIVVTGRGQPFAQGILLDNWRYSGRLAWGPVRGDPHYQWSENPAELVRRLRRSTISADRPKEETSRKAIVRFEPVLPVTANGR